MLAAGEQVATGLTTAPAIVVVGVDASFGDLMLAAEAGLRGTHELAGRAGAGMTLFVARVRTGGPRLCASLAAGVRLQAGDVVRVDVLPAPAVVRGRLFGQARVAARTTPCFWRIVVLLALLALPILLLELALMPFLNAGKMDHGPAQGAGPDARRAENLAGADDALVLAVVDVFVNPSRQVLGGGLGRQRILRSRCLLLWWRSVSRCQPNISIQIYMGRKNTYGFCATG